ncbi:MAG TPA: hypothetical protein VM282_02620 [Acidimicrobiales bacterium]|nr:hypothetical protein [Acidimicrobiales bacterium]
MRKKLLLLMTMVAVLTAGCVQADIKLDVNDDGSGTYTAVFAVNAELFKSLGGLNALDPDAEPADANTDICQQSLDEAADENPADAKIEPYKRGDFCGYKVTASFTSIEEARDFLSGGAGATGGSSLEDVTLEKQGTGWVFDAEWNPSDSGGSTTGTDAAMMKQFLQGFSFVVRLKLPGGQVEQNADLIENDGTMVWNLDPASTRTLNARTEAGAPQVAAGAKTDAGKNINTSAASVGSSGAGDDGGSKTWIYVVIGLVVVAIIAAVVLMKRNKTKAVPAMAGMAGAPMAPGQLMGSSPMGGPSAAPSASPMMAPPVASAPVATAPQPAATEPQWDAARNAYIQWDGVNHRWMQYDQTAGAWKPIE